MDDQFIRVKDDSFIRRKKGINSSISHCALSLFNFFVHLFFCTILRAVTI